MNDTNQITSKNNASKNNLQIIIFLGVIVLLTAGIAGFIIKQKIEEKKKELVKAAYNETKAFLHGESEELLGLSADEWLALVLSDDEIKDVKDIKAHIAKLKELKSKMEPIDSEIIKLVDEQLNESKEELSEELKETEEELDNLDMDTATEEDIHTIQESSEQKINSWIVKTAKELPAVYAKAKADVDKEKLEELKKDVDETVTIETEKTDNQASININIDVDKAKEKASEAVSDLKNKLLH